MVACVVLPLLSYWGHLHRLYRYMHRKQEGRFRDDFGILGVFRGFRGDVRAGCLSNKRWKDEVWWRWDDVALVDFCGW